MRHDLWKLPRLTVLWKGWRFAWKSAEPLFHSPPTGPWKSLRRQVASTISTAAWKTRTTPNARGCSTSSARAHQLALTIVRVRVSHSSHRPYSFDLEKEKNGTRIRGRRPMCPMSYPSPVVAADRENRLRGPANLIVADQSGRQFAVDPTDHAVFFEKRPCFRGSRRVSPIPPLIRPIRPRCSRNVPPSVAPGGCRRSPP